MVAHRTPKNEPHPRTSRTLFRKDFARTRENARVCARTFATHTLLVFVICGFIKNCLPTSYFILQIYHAKSFKMRHVTTLYFNFSVRYS